MKRICLHPLPLRLWHWINALFFVILAVTGLYLRKHGIASLHPHDPLLAWHRTIGYAAVAATVFWFVYNAAAGNLKRHYGMGKSDLAAVPAQVRYYVLSIFRGEKNPHRATAEKKYNPLQKIAYGAVMFVLLPVQAATGLLFADISVFRSAVIAGNLAGPLAAVHTLVAYLLVLYFIVHLYMATLGETFFSHTKAMITGCEEEADDRAEGPDGTE
jgi:thiosulfate reductase cytochrome b subunit